MCFGCATGNQYKKLDKTYSASQYEKVISKADRYIRKNPADPVPFYFKGLTQLYLYKQKSDPQNLASALQNIHRAQQKNTPDFLARDLNNLIREALTISREKMTELETNSPLAAQKIHTLTKQISNYSPTEITYSEKGTTPPALNSATLPSGKRKKVVIESKKYLGTPYRYGGTTTRGFDCSGYTRHVFENVGINLPRTAQQQASAGKKVNKKHVQPGDLVFFTKNKGFGSINHVAIVLETNRHGIQSVIHSTSRGVVIDTYNSGSWQNYWLPRFSKIVTFFND